MRSTRHDRPDEVSARELVVSALAGAALVGGLGIAVLRRWWRS